ncbi:zinc ribbon domain-containing protein [Deinococcus wulumuqiensis]
MHTERPPDHHRIDRYHLPIDRESYASIRHIISTGALRQAGPDHEYRVTNGTPVCVPTDLGIVIGRQKLRVDTYRLPSHAYIAVTRGATLATYPALNALWQLMRDSASQAEVTSVVKDCVAEGRQLVSHPLLIQPDPLFRATWLPEHTLIRAKGGEYQLSLAFSVTHRPTVCEQRRTAVGLDLGLRPMTVAYDHDGRVEQFCLERLTLPDRRLLSADERAVVGQIIYATGRVTSQRVISHLIRTAGRVYAEQLRLADMSAAYRRRARAAAIHDHHWAWLPQALHRAGIRFARVASGETSIECPRCGSALPGNREGSRFECRGCRFAADVHVVAAANVLRRGLRGDPTAQRLYPWPVPPHGK